MNIQDAIHFYNRELKGEYSISETYESLEWHSKNIPKPSLEELENAYNDLLIYREKNKYKDLRKAAYPTIEDQLDLIFHGGLEAWRIEIKKVKDKYPKEPLKLEDTSVALVVRKEEL